MIIRVSKKENPYVTISKTCSNDIRLSWKAKGLHTYILGLPDDFKIHITELQKHSSDGIKSLRSAIQELIDFGYMDRIQKRMNTGTFGEWETAVYEHPKESSSHPQNREAVRHDESKFVRAIDSDGVMTQSAPHTQKGNAVGNGGNTHFSDSDGVMTQSAPHRPLRHPVKGILLINKIQLKEDDISVTSEKIYKDEQPTASAFSKELGYMADSWNETAEETGITPVNLVSLPEKTKTLAVQFWQQHAQEGWDNLLSIIHDSPWLGGKNKDNFKACFGWVLNPTNTEKIINGTYKKFDYAKPMTFSPAEPLTVSPGAGLFPVPDGFLQDFFHTGTSLVYWNSQSGGWYDSAQNEWIARDRDTDWVKVQKEINDTIPLAQMPPTRVNGVEMDNLMHI